MATGKTERRLQNDSVDERRKKWGIKARTERGTQERKRWRQREVFIRQQRGSESVKRDKLRARCDRMSEEQRIRR